MRIPGYKVHKLIAEGGMSSVYLALQRSLGRRVAIKLMKSFGDARRGEHFLREARTIAALHHRNIITIYDVGAVDERHYIAMEYLEGGSLLERIRQGIEPAAAIELLARLADCLDFVHRMGIVHGDVKPSNILFHADGTPKLTDFGIARPVDDGPAGTPSGRTFGSPFYMSPEQAEGRALDGRTDIYALGIVFYEMLTGRQPYRADSHVETILAHLSKPIPMLPQALAGYQGLLEGMLAKRPQDRIATAAQLADRIRQLGAVTKAPGQGDRGPALADAAERLADRLRQAPPRWRAALAGGLGALALGTWWLPERTDTVVVAVSAPAPAAVEDSRVLPHPSTDDRPGTATGARPGPPPRGSASATDAVAVEVAEAVATPTDPAVVPRAQPLPETGHLQGDTATETVPQDATPLIVLPATAGPRPQPADDPEPPAEETTGASPVETAAARQAAIAERMRAGDRALAALRLTTPADDNALLHYSQVLELDPQHAAAAAGIETIAASYSALAHKAREQGDIGRARVYLDRGLTVDPAHGRLLALQAGLDQTDQVALAQQVEPIVLPSPAAPEPTSLRGREGTGNIVKDFVNVWRSIFD